MHAWMVQQKAHLIRHRGRSLKRLEVTGGLGFDRHPSVNSVDQGNEGPSVQAQVHSHAQPGITGLFLSPFLPPLRYFHTSLFFKPCLSLSKVGNMKKLLLEKQI